MLDDRKLRILRAIVTDYVSMREPVGSRALVERYQLDVSPATVRNDMAVLEEEGYITQPHTSAGRIPTDKGYRLFVDRLGAVKPLSSAERRAIETFMAGALDVDDVVRRTVRLLAQITQQVAIVQYPVLSSATIRHRDRHPYARAGKDVRLWTGRAAGVDSVAPDAVVPACATPERHPRRYGPAQAIEQASRPDEPAQSAAGTVRSPLLELISNDPWPGGRPVPNLTRFSDQYETTVRPVLEALEEQVVLLRLLGEATASGDVTVRIGHENSYEPLRSTSVVASAYGANPDAWATLGVVGPTRMDYPSTMAAVRAVARYVGRFLEG